MAKPRPKKNLPDWRTVCRQLAQKQATAEARRLWKAGGVKTIPFNHRWEHVQRVVALALRLAAQTGADPEIVEAAAWLHDIRKGTPGHGQNGAREAKRILAGTNFPAGKIPAVADAIAQHVGLYRAPGAPPLQPIEAAVLWDADKLTKLGVEALAYNLSMNYMRGLTLDQRRSNLLELAQSVLGRTVAGMNTEPGRQEARIRYHAMLGMLAIWQREIEGEYQDESDATPADQFDLGSRSTAPAPESAPEPAPPSPGAPFNPYEEV